MGKIYVYMVTIQGCSAAAAWFNFVIEHALSALFGTAHFHFWTRFVDDFSTFGSTVAQCENRHKILTAALSVLGFKISDKTDNQASEYGQCAGIRFTAQGITLNDDGINTLKLALAQRPKTTAECKTLIGSIMYGHTAFEWRPAEMSWFARMMQPMHTAASATVDIRGKRMRVCMFARVCVCWGGNSIPTV